jgi:hypothetical protein
MRLVSAYGKGTTGSATPFIWRPFAGVVAVEENNQKKADAELSASESPCAGLRGETQEALRQKNAVRLGRFPSALSAINNLYFSSEGTQSFASGGTANALASAEVFVPRSFSLTTSFCVMMKVITPDDRYSAG